MSERSDKSSKWEIVEWTVKSYFNDDEVSLLNEAHSMPVPEGSA